MPPRIGLFAEGYTDQLVIQEVLYGALGEEIEINFVQPIQAGPDANGSYAPGGWTVLFDALRRGEHRRALQFNDWILIHVDTDVCDQPGFDVSRTDDPEALARAVEARLWSLMGDEFCQTEGHRVVFAIAVDEVECWLLPLLFADQPKKRSKTTGCLEAANRELIRRKEKTLLRASGKDPKAYAAWARQLSRPTTLERCAEQSVSLGRLVHRLRAQ